MKKGTSIVIGIIGCIILVSCGLYLLMNSPTFQVAGEIINRVDTDEKVIALTFDDGPNEHTDEILQVLAEKDVKVTFFLIGEQVEQHPEETKKIVAAGHEVGNHSYTHQRMILKPYSFVAEEIEKTDALLQQAGYKNEILFRPPYGKKLVALPRYLADHNKKTITWDIASEKYLGGHAPSEETIQYISERIQPGSIILLHPWYGESNAARDVTPELIDSIKKQGYTFVTVSELLQEM